MGKSAFGPHGRKLHVLKVDVRYRVYDRENALNTSNTSGYHGLQKAAVKDRPYLLSDLLHIIQRHDLIQELGLKENRTTTGGLISPYRKLLYELSENITEDDLKEIKFLLSGELPRKKLEYNVTTLEVFLEMEKCNILNGHNLTRLEGMVCPMLKTKIQKFKGSVSQETEAGLRRTRSASEALPHNAGPSIHLKRPVSCGPPVEQHGPSDRMSVSSLGFSSILNASTEVSNLNRSDTSLDVRRVSDTVEGGLSSGLHLLTTREDNCAAMNKDRPCASNISSHGDNNNSVPANSQTNTKEPSKYAMTGTTRSICLIINNYNFSNSIKYRIREGTQIDEKSLVSVFEWLGFEIHVKSDCTRAQILSLVEEFCKRDYSQGNCLVCCILSHGLEGGVYGVDGEEVKIREITEPFSGLMCNSLKGKPKLFFIQACQGTKEQQPVFLESDSKDSKGSTTTSSICTDAAVPRNSIPADSDFLVAMATVPHFASFRDKKQGTWFIQSLCQNLVNLVPRGFDLLSILTQVNHDGKQPRGAAMG
ncbi:hypothetical protein UPYG_G00314640 [Umbra pygmaea]|uniref:Caspase-8 n=1 Tax=Umbra pygmaea TaxID=75934 RepID=A0ABD0W1E7_UMBPY